MTSLSASFSAVRRTFVMFKVPLERAVFAFFKCVFNFGLLLAEDTLHSNTTSVSFQFQMPNCINFCYHVMCLLLTKDQN